MQTVAIRSRKRGTPFRRLPAKPLQLTSRQTALTVRDSRDQSADVGLGQAAVILEAADGVRVDVNRALAMRGVARIRVEALVPNYARRRSRSGMVSECIDEPRISGLPFLPLSFPAAEVTFETVVARGHRIVMQGEVFEITEHTVTEHALSTFLLMLASEPSPADTANAVAAPDLADQAHLLKARQGVLR
jgi:hypothetical protein